MNGIDSSAARYLWTGEGGQRPKGVDGGREPAGHPAPRQAWLREMERAQLAGWFQPFSPGEASPAGTGSIAVKRGTALPVDAAPMSHAASAAVAFRTPVVSASLWQKPVALPFSETLDASPRHGAAAAQESRGEPDTADARSDVAAGGKPPGQDAVSASSGVGDVPEPRDATASASSDVSLAGLPTVSPAEAAETAGATPGGAGTDAGSERPLVMKPLMDDAAAAWTPARLQAATTPGLAVTMARSALPEFRAPLATAAQWPPSGAEGRPGDPAPALGRQARSMGADPHMQGGNASGTRVYAQWTEAGALLWLGMDGSASQVGFQAAAIVPSLQRALREQGQRLVRVVCNGRVVFDAGMQAATDFIAFSPRSAGLSFSSIFQKGHP